MVLYFWERSASVWIALLYVLMGGLLLAFPAATSTVFVWALAGGAACYGVSHLLRYLQTRKNGEPYKNARLAVREFVTIAREDTHHREGRRSPAGRHRRPAFCAAGR